MISFFSKPTKPVIGISGANADSASVKAMMTQIRDAGATPLFLGNHARRDALRDLGKIDALVVLGNNKDIDPARYGQERHAKTQVETDTPEGSARSEYEFALMQAALQQGMPLLGVCGGMQRLNVLMGGDLHQHVPDITGNNDHAQQDFGIAPFIPVQVVHLEKNGTLSHICDSLMSIFTPAHLKYDYAENSMHHQAVKNVGQGLRAAAYSDDKIIEAIEADPNGPLKKNFIVGVQWHPEFSASPLGKKIAHHLTSEAQKYASKTKRQHPPSEAQDETIFSALADLKAPTEPVSVSPGGWVDAILKRRTQPQSSLRGA